MQIRRWTLCALCCLLLSWTAQARFIVEQGGLQIKFPDAAKSEFPNGFDTSLANFGSPKYGGSIVGSLLYVDKDWGEDFECKPIPCNYGCQDFREASPPFSLSGSYIMMVDRGPEEPGMQPCKFALKVWNAQQAGATGVIVVNYEDRSTTMEAPDDEDRSLKYLQNITIPAAFVTKSVGDSLKTLIKPQKDLPHPKVLVSLDWTDLLPRNETVHWEFWSNSNDMCGPVCDVQKDFIKEFQPVATEFEKQGWTKFTPHYLVWVCPDSYHQSAECQSQCIRQGRYCTPDPDGDIRQGYSGKDIVQENLRQLCVFKLANDNGQPWHWWDYVTKFGDECSMDDKTYDEACAERIFTEIGGEQWSSMSALRQCIGDPDSDSPSDIMDAEMAGQRGSASEGEVYILPTIRINTGQYRGKLSYYEVLRAICAGFNKHNEPAACNRVGEDDCRIGAAGQRDCASRTDGKTMCKETFASYQCVCGSGFISHLDATTGEETCLDINECLTIDATQLDAKCTCERCACKNVFGGYECLPDLADECAVSNGGCWQGQYTVKGSKQTFSACKDQLQAVKQAAAHGQDVSQMPLHTCECPPCFESKGSGSSLTCTPKCTLDSCDLTTGVCSPGSGSSGGTQALSVLLTVALVCVVLGAVGYGVYQFRIRSAMHQEIRAIMRQYMPLQETDGSGGAAASNGLEPLNGMDK